MPKLDPQLLSYGQTLYVLLKSNNPELILREEEDNMTFKTLKENSINPLALGYLNIRFPFLFLSMKKKAMPLGCSPQNLRTINPQGISAAGPCGVETTPCPRALLPLPWGNYCGISSNYLCTPSNRSPPEFSSYSAFFNQYLASYEILLLTDLQITLSNCSNFNSTIVPLLCFILFLEVQVGTDILQCIFSVRVQDFIH